jgi:hypothetical protein
MKLPFYLKKCGGEGGNRHQKHQNTIKNTKTMSSVEKIVSHHFFLVRLTRRNSRNEKLGGGCFEHHQCYQLFIFQPPQGDWEVKAHKR